MATDSYNGELKAGLFRSLIDQLDLSAVEVDRYTEHFKRSHDQLDELLSLQFYKALDSEKGDLLSEHYKLLSEFRERLFATWKTPLERLDSLLYMCMEVVSELRQKHIDSSQAITNKFNISTRLQARCVQVGNEISHLLHGGYADGAFARWRTLHETSTTTKFICEGDEDLSSRFIDYQTILRLQSAIRYNENKELNFEPIPTEKITQLQNKKAEILGKYGVQFGQSFGWARKALGDNVSEKGNLKFTNLEDYVGLSFLRSHFGLANQYIHAGIDSIGYKLGTSMSNRDLLLTGPSNEGLMEPIQCTSLSVVYATSALINAYPDDDSSIKTSVLWLWHQILQQEVYGAHKALQVMATHLAD